MSEKGRKKRLFFFFTHQQAVVFRFKMPLQAHRKHCSCVSHHSMKSPLPSGGRMKPSGKSCSQLLPATPSLLGALQSTSHVPPSSTPGCIPLYQKQQALSSRALQPLDTRLYTSEVLFCHQCSVQGAAHSRYFKMFVGWMDEWMMNEQVGRQMDWWAGRWGVDRRKEGGLVDR